MFESGLDKILDDEYPEWVKPLLKQLSLV